jgi:hypothetical protein
MKFQDECRINRPHFGEEKSVNKFLVKVIITQKPKKLKSQDVRML